MTAPDESFDVFLSHSSRDKDIIRRLASRLRAAGLSLWLDEERIKPGDSIVDEIEHGLRSSRFVIVCLSKSLAKSNWVRREYGPLLHREITQRRKGVIPLQLEAVSEEEIPLLLYDKLWVHFDDSEAMRRLMDYLISERSAREVVGAAERLKPAARLDAVLEYHDNLLDTWLSMGSPESQRWVVSGWGSAESQELRFRALIEAVNLDGGSVLDLGCGLGDLASYLRRRGLLGRYEGWDLNPRLIGHARRIHPDLHFEVLDHSHLPHDEFDFVLGSGIFQYRDPDNEKYYADLCHDIYSRCRVGIAVNFLSSLRDRAQMTPDELYLEPHAVIEVLRKITGYWTLDHSYHPGFGDFTVGLLRPTPLPTPWQRPLATIR